MSNWTLEQLKNWIDAAFPDNVARLITEADLRDVLKRTAEWVQETNSSSYIGESIERAEHLATQAATSRADIALIFDQAQALLSDYQVLAAQAYRRKGNWNVEENLPDLSALTGKADGDGYVVEVGGSTDLTGTTLTASKGDAFIWNAADAKWIYYPNAQPDPSGNVAAGDTRAVSGQKVEKALHASKGNNLFAYANVSHWMWDRVSHSTTSYPTLRNQVGTNSIQAVEYPGFGYAWKLDFPAASNRVNVHSSNVMAGLSVGQKIQGGFFIKCANFSTLTVQTGLTINVSTVATQTTEYVELGNGWRYYRHVSAYSVPEETTSLKLYIYLTATSSLTTCYLASPALVATDQKLLAGQYAGIEADLNSRISGVESTLPTVQTTLNTLESKVAAGIHRNYVFDSDFASQSGSALSGPWTRFAAGGFNSPAIEFTADKNISGTRVLKVNHAKTSSERSDFQLLYLLEIPQSRLAEPVFSFAYLIKSPAGVSVLARSIQFYSDQAGLTLLDTVTPSITVGTVDSFGYALVKVENISIPAGCQSFRIGSRTQMQSAAEVGSYPTYLANFVVVFASKIDRLLTEAKAIFADQSRVAVTAQSALQADESLQTNNASKWSLFYGKKWCTYGSSTAAANQFQPLVAARYNLTSYVRGCGGSSVTASTNVMAVRPDGQYITRRNIYASQALFEAAILAAGYEHLVEEPTWLEYSQDPSSYSLEVGSYFLVETKGSSLERIATIPLDSQVIMPIWGSNETGDSTPIGTVSDFGEGSFYGEYRLMLKRMKQRCPAARIVLCNMQKRTNEFDSETDSLTSFGLRFNQIREAIRQIGLTYGYEVLDLSPAIGSLDSELLSDGVHANSAGYANMARIVSNYFK